MSQLATFQVGNYVIFKKRIGKGAFSNIYKGYHQYSKEMVAIKEISLDTLNKYEKSLRRETQIMRHLNHPNIVRLIENIIDDKTDNVYLVMEYFPRGDFSKFLKKRPLKEKYAIKYLKQIMEGMKYLLSHKIIHRDLKPQNILVSNTGVLKITDFGFARYFDNDILIQTICGSPLYMAPEIMKNKKYDYKSDLWSIGIIFFEMLTGKPPFQARNIYELIRKIENDSIHIPSKFNLSRPCQNLLLSLLEKDPERRISWDDFFNHSLLYEADPLECENKLLEISNLSTLPNLEKSESVFDSLVINSEIEKTNSNLNNQNLNLSIHPNTENFNTLAQTKIVTGNTQSSFHSETDIIGEINFNFNLDQSDSIDGNNMSSDEDDENFENDRYYDSFENPSQMRDSSFPNHTEDDFIKVDIENNYFKSSLSLRQNIIRRELPSSYVYIDIPRKRNRNNNMSKSLLNYLNTSVSFLKESYTYFYNYNSI
jgi:serine/threonine protein kinase